MDQTCFLLDITRNDWICQKRNVLQIISAFKAKVLAIKHLLDETESNIQFIASGRGNIGQSEAEPSIILYGRNGLDVGRGQVQWVFIIPKKSGQIN